MIWNPTAIRAQVTEAIDYLQDVHGSATVLDWWEDQGKRAKWIIPWSTIPAIQHAGIHEALADKLDYLAVALDNMDTEDVGIAILQLDRIVRRLGKKK